MILYQVLQGIKYIHDQGMVHRDLKLENILMTSFDPSGRVVISDFGYARDIPFETTQRGSVRMSRMKTYLGSPGYYAPYVIFSVSTMKSANDCAESSRTLQTRATPKRLICGLLGL